MLTWFTLVHLGSGLMLEREREKGVWSVEVGGPCFLLRLMCKKNYGTTHQSQSHMVIASHPPVRPSWLSPNTMTLLPTLLPFKTLLRKHLPSLRSSPCLLISSSPPINTVQPNKRIDEFVRSSAQLLLSQNIRSIPITIDAAYPTKQKIKESLLVRR